MWWDEIRDLGQRLSRAEITGISPDAIVDHGALLDESGGAISIGARTRVCPGAVIKGPVTIGEDCLIGNQAMVRGATVIGNGVRIGFATEIKQALISDGATIGPMCFVADSRVDEEAYLGAMVRTSNHRLDQQPINVIAQGDTIETGMEKLGCWIGAGASLGIQVIILPGRVVAAGSLFEPRLTISRNHPAGHYRLKQTLEMV